VTAAISWRIASRRPTPLEGPTLIDSLRLFDGCGQATCHSFSQFETLRWFEAFLNGTRPQTDIHSQNGGSLSDRLRIAML
jgi:hypothetical protein